VRAPAITQVLYFAASHASSGCTVLYSPAHHVSTRVTPVRAQNTALLMSPMAHLLYPLFSQVHGDKDLFPLAFAAAGKGREYAQVPAVLQPRTKTSSTVTAAARS
jgi:hypothetical protein